MERGGDTPCTVHDPSPAEIHLSLGVLTSGIDCRSSFPSGVGVASSEGGVGFIFGELVVQIPTDVVPEGHPGRGGQAEGDWRWMCSVSGFKSKIHQRCPGGVTHGGRGVEKKNQKVSGSMELRGAEPSGFRREATL